MKTVILALAAAAALCLAGCSKKEVSKEDQAQSAAMISEADFAVTLRDWARAEDLYVKALRLTPDAGDVWLNLGIVRMRSGDRSGARSAYKRAVDAYAADFKASHTHSQSVIRQAYALVLLGRADEARSVASRAHEAVPDDRILRDFVEAKGVDRMVSDPGLRSLSP